MAENSTSLVLNDKEASLIREILEERYKRFLLEISHADHHDFKNALREKTGLVESVLSRLGGGAASTPADRDPSKKARVEVKLSA